MRVFMHSKIHHAYVTQTELNYIGSVVVDSALMDKANIGENEQVQICNVSNGQRWETYCLPGKAYSGIISVQGPGARLAQKGDCLVIITYQYLESSPSDVYTILVDENNQFIRSLP